MANTKKSGNGTNKRTAQKQVQRQVERKAKRAVKKGVKKAAKNKVFVTIVVILLIIAIIGCFVLYRKGFFDKYLNGGNNESNNGKNNGADQEPVLTGEVQIHFLELGNKYTGDCSLIKVGNTEILIDAGSRANSAPTIVNYLKNYVTDGKLEYVIATHAHQDHIAGFPGVLAEFETGTIIDFARTNETSTVHNKYVEARDAEVAAGAKHYTALECWKEENGAKKTYYLDSENKVSMNVLYNYYYENNTSNENNYSVCILLTQGTNNYLFTGDLEADGEKKLVDNNDLPHCELFKGGHHGSYTANSEYLMDKIQPEIVCVCTCCGTAEYPATSENVFPSQAFCDNVGKYTDKIYLTTLIEDYKNGTFASMNGNIVITSDGGELTVHCSNNDTILKETAWFKDHRKWNGV